MILKELDRGAFFVVWKLLKVKELDRGRFLGDFVTVLILKDLDRGAKGRVLIPHRIAGRKGREPKDLHRGAAGRKGARALLRLSFGE
jgi:hypothetical protein